MKSPLRHLPALISTIALATAISANAGLLVDRGLPTANLNNAAGADRANVDWVETDYTPGNYWLDGDTFQNTSSQTWSINTIRLWTDGTVESAVLWGGVQGSGIGIVQNSGVISDTAYADAHGYQARSGDYYPLHQVDFAVNILLAPGQTYNFFLDGASSDSGYTLPFVEASNMALSGWSNDGGADNLMLKANVLNGAIDLGSIVTWDSKAPNTWDKSSDIDVQVFGTPVPEPTTMLAGALLLLPFGVSTVRKLRKNRTA
jgi:hypothetical protein